MRCKLATGIAATATLGCTASLLAVGSIPASAATATSSATATVNDLGSVEQGARSGGVIAIVTTTKDSGRGSLRAALNAANKFSRKTTTSISFAATGTIILKRDLPAIKRKVIIDATSAAGYVPGGAPVVGINATGHRALRFDGGSRGSQVLGLSVTKSNGNGITLFAGEITLNGNYVGLSISGKSAGNRGDGIYIARSSKKNRIGLNPSNTPQFAANVLSANRGAGLRIVGSSFNQVFANRVGTNAAGTAEKGNRHGGIELFGASRNRIGGIVVGVNANGPNNPTGTEGNTPENYVAPPLGNLVSGNKRDGILISSGSKLNVLSGNFVGTNAAGVKAVPNGIDGVHVLNSDGTVLRGCTVTDNPFVYYNVISGNRKNGLHVTSSDNTVVQANFFGIGMDNTTTVANRLNGMLFDGNSKKPHVGGVIPLGNVAAGNGANGIAVKDQVSGFITFNTFGGLLAFKGAAPNKQNGLLVTATGGNNLARTNVFSGNRRNGVLIGGSARGMTLDPNIIGLNTKGDGPLRNRGNGVVVTDNAHHNVIGGNRGSVIPQNAFSGNLGYGLVLSGNSHDNRVYNTFVGTGVAISTPVPNVKGGILVSDRAHNNYIGARGQQKINVIAGNIGYGVTLTANTRSNSVIKNNIGKGREGLPVPNTKGNVSNKGKKNVIRRNNS